MTGNFLPLLADRVINCPLLLHPAKAEAVLSVLEGRVIIGALDADQISSPDASRFVGGAGRAGKPPLRLTRAAGKTALITIDGSLVNRGAWVGANSGLVSYEGISAQLDEVEAEAKAGHIENLVIDMNSHGGEASGMYGVAAKIRNLRKRMHIVAVVNDIAASAGYGIISGADRIVVSPTSMVGSIGVVIMHIDRSGEMEKKGRKPTFIHAGAKKVDGHPFGPLRQAVRDALQRDVDTFYDRFLETVEAGRGKARLSAKKARETEAAVFLGHDAVKAGLADRIGTLEEVLAELSHPPRSRGSNPERKTHMERDELSSSAARAERERIGAILNSAEGKARPQAAIKIALASEAFSAETARSVLAGFPQETPAATTPSIQQRAETRVEIGASGPAPAGPEAAKSGWGKAIAGANRDKTVIS